MWHEHGVRDLDWQPELQAERMIAAEMLGQAAMYLTSVNGMCSEEFEATGCISEKSRSRLSDAYKRRAEVIAWLTNISKRIYEVEQ